MNTPQSTNDNLQPSIDWTITTPALLLILAIGGSMLAFPEAGAAYAKAAKAFITGNLGWLYLSLGGGALVFCAWLAFGPYAHVVLGTVGEKPEYSDLHWVAMMFTAGVGASLIAWAAAEPVYYLNTPPFGAEPFSSTAVEWAHAYPIFHWGIIPWAFYAIPAVPIAYMLYVKKVPMLKVSGACESALPVTGRKAIGKVIDTVIALGIVGGTATSLGLGVPLVAAMSAELLGIPDTITTKLVVLIIWTALFSASAYRGLKKGIKVLADINMVLAAIAILFILLAGPTLFILSMTVNSIGLLADNFVRMALWMDPVSKSGFPEAWTIFYWAWWIAFAAFIGLFFGRISRGRTIRQLVLGVIGWGTLGTTTYLVIIGGYSLYLETSGMLPVAEILRESGMSVLGAKVISSLPFGKVALSVFIVLSIIFYATTLDSAAYTVASVCTKDLHNDQEPPRVSRLVWAFALALFTFGLVVSDSLEAVQASTVVFSLPLLPVIVLMVISLVRWLRRDFGTGVAKHTADS